MLDAILEFATTGRVPSVFEEASKRGVNSVHGKTEAEVELPQRMEGSHLCRHSKVLEVDAGGSGRLRPLPSCPVPILAVPQPLNESVPASVVSNDPLSISIRLF